MVQSERERETERLDNRTLIGHGAGGEMRLRYSVILTPVSETVPLYPLPLPRKTFHSSVERKKMPTVLISTQNNKPAAAQSHNCWK